VRATRRASRNGVEVRPHGWMGRGRRFGRDPLLTLGG
jgi:hypothetical protein